MSCYIAAALHDYDHPGVNNPFLVAMNNEKAWSHNDKSVLENYHIASSFKLMEDPSRCWSSKMTNADFKRCRQVIILTVLNTDMAKHFKELGKLSIRVTDPSFQPHDSKDQEMLIKFMFHMADISNPTKPFKICRNWTDLLFVEFFMQGDLERAHPQTFPNISQFFDRKTTNIAKSQIGYINFIKLPSYATIIKVFPKL